MTQEEKARRYDEAIDVCRKLYNKAKADGYTSDIEDYENIFPELAESEDEMFRKYILKCCEETISAYDRGLELSMNTTIRLKNWLEKQGEQPKDVTYTHEVKTGNGNIKALVTEKVQLPKKFERQGEQKPNFCHHEVDLSGCSDEYCKAYYDGWNNCNQQHAQLEAEKKPTEWSEEDKTILKILNELVNTTPSKDFFDATKEKCIFWLKSLKDRVQPQIKQKWSEYDSEHINSLLKRLEGMCKKGATFTRTRFAVSEDIDWLKSLKGSIQPKQEWSEEDKETINNLIDYLENELDSSYTDLDKESFAKEIKLLKSLSFQSHWKPSDEQMKQLDWIAEQNKDNMIGKELMTLYNDLKKL